MVIKLRLKNVKNAYSIIKEGKYYIENYHDYFGKWSTYFNNNNPIYIEIGMGKGKFILENAIKYPNINFIGIEKFDSVIVRAIQKSNEYELNNLVLIRMDAEKIDEVFSKEVSKIYLNFSDPWPKARHEKRRLTSNVFLKKYDSIFKNDKIIEMKTDNIDLFDFSLESLTTYGYDIINKTNDLNDDNNILTEYEEKFRNKNIGINKLIAIKKDTF